MQPAQAIARTLTAIAARLRGACPVCADAPRYRVVWPPEGPPFSSTAAVAHIPEPPAVCPGCGRPATVIQVTYVDGGLDIHTAFNIAEASEES